MKKYEYQMIDSPAIGTSEMVKKLKEEGAKGWRLVPSFFFTKRGKMLLEREKEEKT